MDGTTNPILLNNIPDYEFEDALIGEIRITVKTVLTSVHQCMGIPIMEYFLFMQLLTEKELSQAELQRRLGVDGAVVTRLVKQLESDGLVIRRPDPADNRFTLVALTEKAARLAEEKLDRRRKLVSVLTRDINDEDINCLKRVLSQVRQNALELAANGEAMKQ